MKEDHRPFARSHRLARLRTGTATALLACALAACGDDPVEPEPVVPVATSIEVAPGSATLTSIDETVQLSATVRDQTGQTMAGASVDWSSGAVEVAVVDGSGVVTASGDGTATITATSGAASGSATVTVRQEAATVTVSPETMAFTAIGQTMQFSAEAADANGNYVEAASTSWSTDNEAVATVDDAGLVTATGGGTATITATVGSASAGAAVEVVAPTEGPPAPTHDAADIISLFSDAYEDVGIDTWSAEWDQADLADIEIAGNPVKLYTSLTFAGIDFSSQTIDASGMTHFHFDMWTPDPTVTSAFLVKLVDFGANGVWEGPFVDDDTEHISTLTAASNPPLETGKWISYELALADMTALAATEHIAQLIISGDPNTVYLDNIYFRAGEPPPPPAEPSEPAPAPTHAAEDVISLYSDAYEDRQVDTWSADWDQAHQEEVSIGGNATQKYTGLTFAGIEFTSQTIDVTEMTHFRFDMWTPDPTVNAAFKVKLVDFGANGVWEGPFVDDDTEHEITLDAASTPGLATGTWVSYDIPLADFTAMTGRTNVAQLIISGDPNTVYLDNIYFRK